MRFFMLDVYSLVKRYLTHPKLYFGGPDPPAVQNISPAGQDANAAKAAGDAAELQRKKLEKERGQAANILGGKDIQTKTSDKPTLLSGLPT
jgi:hypothetical protein